MMQKIKELWYKIPEKGRNHILSALQTFSITFLALLQTGIEGGNALTGAFIASILRAATRETVYQLAKYNYK